jgi:hypothetical protein
MSIEKRKGSILGTKVSEEEVLKELGEPKDWDADEAKLYAQYYQTPKPRERDQKAKVIRLERVQSTEIPTAMAASTASAPEGDGEDGSEGGHDGESGK